MSHIDSNVYADIETGGQGLFVIALAIMSSSLRHFSRDMSWVTQYMVIWKWYPNVRWMHSMHAKNWHTKNYCSHLNNYWCHKKNYGVLQYILRCDTVEITFMWKITGRNRKNYGVLQYILRCDTVIFVFYTTKKYSVPFLAIYPHPTSCD